MFHNNLKTQRLKCGLSQKQVADFICVTPQSISKWEKGESLPSVDYLPKLAECFNCDINTFFEKEQGMSKDCSTIFTLFELLTDIYDEISGDRINKHILENSEVINTSIAACKELLEHRTVNIRSIRGILNCSDAEARTFMGYLERGEMIERLDVEDFYYVVKDAVEGFIVLLKIRLELCEVIRKLEEKD